MVWHGVKYGWLRDLAGPLNLEHFWRQVRGAVLPLPTKQQRELFNLFHSISSPSLNLTYVFLNFGGAGLLPSTCCSPHCPCWRYASRLHRPLSLRLQRALSWMEGTV